MQRIHLVTERKTEKVKKDSFEKCLRIVCKQKKPLCFKKMFLKLCTLNERLIFLYWFGKKSTRLIKIFLKRINSSVLESLIVNLVRTAALYKMAKGVLKSKHNSLV
jgi:hypothetical protein